MQSKLMATTMAGALSLVAAPVLAQGVGAGGVTSVAPDPVFIGQRAPLNFDSSFTGTDRLRLQLQANSLTDYGGGLQTGLQVNALDPGLTGGGLDSGLISGHLGHLQTFTPSGGRLIVQGYGEGNYQFVNVNFDGGADDDSFVGTAPAKNMGAVAAYEFGRGSDYYLGARVAGAFGWNRVDYKFPGNDDVGCNIDEPDQNLCLVDANVFFGSPLWGKLTLGLGETAYAGIADISLGGINYATNADIAGKYGELDRIFPDVAGAGRSTGVQYVSPTIAGFSLSASWGDSAPVDAPRDAGQTWGAALRYAGEFGTIRVAAGIGYGNTTIESPGDDISQTNVSGSASVLHTPTGLFLSGSVGNVNRSDGDFDPSPDESKNSTQYYAQAGIRQNWISWGETTAYGEFAYATNAERFGTYYDDDASATNFGLGITQDIDAAATSIYINYNRVNLDNGSSNDHMDIITAGARIKY